MERFQIVLSQDKKELIMNKYVKVFMLLVDNILFLCYKILINCETCQLKLPRTESDIIKVLNSQKTQRSSIYSDITHNNSKFSHSRIWVRQSFRLYYLIMKIVDTFFPDKSRNEKSWLIVLQYIFVTQAVRLKAIQRVNNIQHILNVWKGQMTASHVPDLCSIVKQLCYVEVPKYSKSVHYFCNYH